MQVNPGLFWPRHCKKCDMFNLGVYIGKIEQIAKDMKVKYDEDKIGKLVERR